MFCLLYVIMWNIRTLDFNYYEKYFPKHYNWLGQTLRIEQYWNMFAPYPLRDDGWYVIDGTFSDGQKFDVFNSKKTISFEKPDFVSKTYSGQRWRKYMMNIWFKKYSKHRLYYGKYLCRTFSEKHPDLPLLQSFKLYFVKRIYGEKIINSAPREHITMGSQMLSLEDTLLNSDFIDTLEQGEIEFKLYHHKLETVSCEQSAVERSVKLNQTLKCMLAKAPEIPLILLMLRGDHKLKIKKVRNLLNTRVNLLDDDEIKVWDLQRAQFHHL